MFTRELVRSPSKTAGRTSARAGLWLRRGQRIGSRAPRRCRRGSDRWPAH